MTNVALVARKLAILDEHLRRIRERRPDDLEAFRRDLLLQDAVAMSVLVVVQEGMDIALHIASDEGWELATTYREAFVVRRHRPNPYPFTRGCATTEKSPRARVRVARRVTLVERVARGNVRL